MSPSGGASQVIHIAVCDDDETVRLQLSEYAKCFSEEKCIPLKLTLFTSGEALLKTDISQFDLLFLDIQMGGIDGMTTARAIRTENQELKLVFITNYEQYAIEGYEVQAFRFLKKPIDYQQFAEVTGKTIASIVKDRDHVALKTRSGIHHLRISHILYAETYRWHVLIHSSAGNVECHHSMNALEKQLGSQFFRCHAAYLVNMKHILEMRSTEAVLSDQTIIPISKHRRAAFYAATMEYWGDSLL